MTWQFRKHYTRDEARALLPQVRKWLKQLGELRALIQTADGRLSQMLAAGNDIGGESVNQWVKQLCALKNLLHEFRRREIQIKDVERGLIDFPAFIEGKEVFLCWEQDEEDIEYWHDLESGYAGRERID